MSTASALYPAELQQRVDAYLAGLSLGGTAQGVETLVEAMRYSLLAGGKRVRPVLALATAEALGHDAESVLPFAGAIEMIHTYSLIHDDLPAMDDDELRRGQPTCHVAYGEDVAILAGDGLFAEALRLAAAEQQADPAALLAAVAELTAAVGVDGMVGGQFLDVTAPGDLGPADLRRVHELKTGRLIAASVNCVLHLCQASPSARLSYGRFAAELGVLFQIVDDILDVTGDDTALGKPSGSDERHGKRTYVTVFGLDRARELARESHSEARAALAESAGDTETLERVADHILTRQN
ncbi:MAG TPA: farnesyl diphosphate synthase [Thermoleophilaceae bacterium]|nr:farnesyl diphosphate synthase [Thermoleophilaceae bacterium]